MPFMLGDTLNLGCPELMILPMTQKKDKAVSRTHKAIVLVAVLQVAIVEDTAKNRQKEQSN